MGMGILLNIIRIKLSLIGNYIIPKCRRVTKHSFQPKGKRNRGQNIALDKNCFIIIKEKHNYQHKKLLGVKGITTKTIINKKYFWNPTVFLFVNCFLL